MSYCTRCFLCTKADRSKVYRSFSYFFSGLKLRKHFNEIIYLNNGPSVCSVYATTHHMPTSMFKCLAAVDANVVKLSNTAGSCPRNWSSNRLYSLSSSASASGVFASRVGSFDLADGSVVDCDKSLHCRNRFSLRRIDTAPGDSNFDNIYEWTKIMMKIYIPITGNRTYLQHFDSVFFSFSSQKSHFDASFGLPMAELSNCCRNVKLANVKNIFGGAAFKPPSGTCPTNAQQE